jgi:hypothetical protein
MSRIQDQADRGISTNYVLIGPATRAAHTTAWANLRRFMNVLQVWKRNIMKDKHHS